MSATVSLPPDVAAYLDQVRAALADLPAGERDELLADVETSLVEGAADSAEPIEVRLGPADRFAGELRAAAGLDAPAPAPADETAGLLARLEGLLAHPRVRSAHATAKELAPVWWVLRGYVAVCALALLSGAPWTEAFPMVPRIGDAFYSFVLMTAGVAGSVWLGLRRIRSRWLTAFNALVLVMALPVLTQAADGRTTSAAASEVYYEVPATEALNVNGEPVRNIYPYDRNGKLLLDVLLYDDLGRPLDVGSRDMQMDPLRRYVFTGAGQPLRNTFPIRYFEPGTSGVDDPLSAPEDIEVPEIATPPLKRP